MPATHTFATLCARLNRTPVYNLPNPRNLR
jgi:hypothetical protein